MRKKMPAKSLAVVPAARGNGPGLDVPADPRDVDRHPPADIHLTHKTGGRGNTYTSNVVEGGHALAY